MANPETILEVSEAFVSPLGSFTRYELVAADDPVVKKYPQHFRPPTVRRTVKAKPVEQATAAPGEKRGSR